LCCVAHSFQVSGAFAFDKAAGEACRYLRSDFRCEIHHELTQRGFGGCAAYDCFGAGQRIAQSFVGGEAVRQRAFLILRAIHEMLFFLTQAATMCPTQASGLREELFVEIENLERLGCEVVEGDGRIDTEEARRRVKELVRRVGWEIRRR
jgi:hypothetical protein